MRKFACITSAERLRLNRGGGKKDFANYFPKSVNIYANALKYISYTINFLLIVLVLSFVSAKCYYQQQLPENVRSCKTAPSAASVYYKDQWAERTHFWLLWWTQARRRDYQHRGRGPAGGGLELGRRLITFASRERGASSLGLIPMYLG